jgi:hypothetical protein
MRIPRTLRAGLLIAAAVVLGLLTVQGTYALWNAGASVAPGTISSASFDVSLKESPSGTPINMTLPSGGQATIGLTPAGTLSPGSPVYAGIVVANNSNAGGTFSTHLTAGQPTVSNVGTGALAQYVIVSAVFAPPGTSCTAAAGYASLMTTGLTTATAVPKAASTLICFQVSLPSTTPASVKGKAVNITLPITARQLCGVPGGC